MGLRRVTSRLLCLLATAATVPAGAQAAPADSLARGVAQLRHAIGSWSATTGAARGAVDSRPRRPGSPGAPRMEWCTG